MKTYTYLFSITIYLLSSLLTTAYAKNFKTTLVYASDNSVQCFSDVGINIDESAEKLSNQGIDVLKSGCGEKTGFAVITVCGAGTLRINIHKIYKANLADARDLGYEDISKLRIDRKDKGYVLRKCPHYTGGSIDS